MKNKKPTEDGANPTYVELEKALRTCDNYFCPLCEVQHTAETPTMFEKHLPIIVASYAASDLYCYSRQRFFKVSGQYAAALAAVEAGKAAR